MTELEPLRMTFKGPVGSFIADTTEQVCMEGAIRSGKTTAALWKVLASALQNPGIRWLMCRYSDGDTSNKLRPEFERICLEAGVPLTWHAQGRYYQLPNESMIYAFGIKAQSIAERYAKFRGVTLAGIYNDQTEELPADIYEELVGRLSQQGYPHQILLTPNPMEEDSWLADRFPVTNSIRHRHYYQVSLYDNAHNLDRDTVERLERTYPVGHSKHGPMLLGKRGMNVIGKPVYGPITPHQPETAAFKRDKHVHPLAMDPDLPLLEGIDFGRSHPCVVWAQYTPFGALNVLGGVMGHHLYLEDFAPIIQTYRKRWFADALIVHSCCDPAGGNQGLHDSGKSVLEELGFSVTSKSDSNMPQVRLAVVERIAGHMRRQTPRGEAFAIDDSRWLHIRSDGDTARKWQFLADGCEAGYVWDEHMVSVGSKGMRKPKKDGWYDHGQNCLEYIEHNFGGVQPTLEQAARHAANVRTRATRRSQYDVDPADAYLQRRQGAPRGITRGGY